MKYYHLVSFYTYSPSAQYPATISRFPVFLFELQHAIFWSSNSPIKFISKHRLSNYTYVILEAKDLHYKDRWFAFLWLIIFFCIMKMQVIIVLQKPQSDHRHTPNHVFNLFRLRYLICDCTMATPLNRQRSARKPEVAGKLKSELPNCMSRRWHCDWWNMTTVSWNLSSHRLLSQLSILYWKVNICSKQNHLIPFKAIYTL